MRASVLWVAGRPLADLAQVCGAAGGGLGLVAGWMGPWAVNDLTAAGIGAGLGSAGGGALGLVVWLLSRTLRGSRAPGATPGDGVVEPFPVAGNGQPRQPAPAAAPGSLVEWPLQVGRPPTRARAFQERAALSDQITSVMGSGGSAVLSQVVASGGGGVGKTQLAADVFTRSRARGVELVVWVNASSRDSILATFAQARRAIEPGAFGVSVAEAAEAFLGWLGATSRSWLVVLDDVADPRDVRGLWPEGRSGCVLATTRRRDLAPASSRLITVDVFSADEAVRYLVDRFADASAQRAHPRVLDGAAELAEGLGRLPVALAQAAAVILNDGITCAEYGQRFADRAATVERLFPEDARVDDYTHTLATTWSLAIDRADRLPPVGLALPALQLASVVDPNGAPESLWLTGSARAFLTRHRRTGSTPDDAGTGDAPDGDGGAELTSDDARAALRNLHRLSLVDHDAGGGALAVRTHALTQRSVLDPLTPEHRRDVVRTAADALVEIWPPTERDPDHSRVLRQNASVLADRDPDALWQDGAHALLLRAGQSLGELGLVREAVGYGLGLVAAAERQLGPDHLDTLATRHALADWRGAAGDFSDAIEAFTDLLADSVRVLGPDHPDTLATRHALAYWRGVAGDVVGAVDACGVLLDDAIRVLGPGHPDTVAIRHTLAHCRGVAGEVRQATRAFEDLLADAERVLGPDHPDTLVTRHALAYWRGAAGDAAGAAAAFAELLEHSTEVLGSDHPDTLTIRHTLAYYQGAAGDPAHAVEAFQRLLDDRLRILGPDHPETLANRIAVAHWRGEAGDVAGARSDFQKLRSDRDRLALPTGGHPDQFDTAIAHGLAHYLTLSGDNQGAIRVLGELLDDQSRSLGADHPQAFATRIHLASQRGAAGDPGAAVRALEELLDDQSRVLGPDHPQMLTTRGQLARWRGRTGDAAGAAQAFEELLADRLRVFGPSSLQVLTTCHSLACWRGAAGDVPGVVQALDDLQGHSQRILGEDHPHTRAVRRHLARWRDLRRTPAAISRALADLRRDRLRLPGTYNPNIVLATRLLVVDWQVERRRRAGQRHTSGAHPGPPSATAPGT